MFPDPFIWEGKPTEKPLAHPLVMMTCYPGAAVKNPATSLWYHRCNNSCVLEIYQYTVV